MKQQGQFNLNTVLLGIVLAVTGYLDVQVKTVLESFHTLDVRVSRIEQQLTDGKNHVRNSGEHSGFKPATNKI